MIFIDSVDIIESDRLRDCPFTIPMLKDLTVFFGMNGTGKTTILEAMRREGSKKIFGTKVKLNFTNKVEMKKTEIYSMFQKELSHVKHDFNLYTDGMLGAWDVMNSFNSAGERSRNQLDTVKKVENSVFFIDEMDSSLDWKGQKTYFNMLKRMSKTNQIFVSTHSVIFCAMAGVVYDVGERRWSDFNMLKETYKLPKKFV